MSWDLKQLILYSQKELIWAKTSKMCGGAILAYSSISSANQDRESCVYWFTKGILSDTLG